MDYATNLLLSGITTIYAMANRVAIRPILRKKIPSKITKLYDEISPTIEHFFYGFAATSLGYGLGFIEDIPGRRGYGLVKGEDLDNKGAFATGGFAIIMDLVHEARQADERKKFHPAQFLGTCAGVLTSITMNNLEKIIN